MKKEYRINGLKVTLEEAEEILKQEKKDRQEFREKLKKEQTKKQNSIKVEDLIKEEHYEHSS